MRPPYLSASPISEAFGQSFTPSPILQTPNVWMNLTSDNSVQILPLDTSRNEDSFTGPSSVSNQLKLLQTIYSTNDSSDNLGTSASEDNYKQVGIASAAVKTHVSFDTVSRQNGALLDARIIFTPTPNSPRREQQHNSRTDATLTDDRFETSAWRRAHARNCKSDSELTNIQHEGVIDLSMSKPRQTHSDNRLSTIRSPVYPEDRAEDAFYVKPLMPTTNSSQFGNVKRVQLKTFPHQIKTEAVRGRSIITRKLGVGSKHLEREKRPLKPVECVSDYEKTSADMYSRLDKGNESGNSVARKRTCCESLDIGCQTTPGKRSGRKIRRSAPIGGLSDFLRRHETPTDADSGIERSQGNKNTVCKRLYDNDHCDKTRENDKQPIKRRKTFYGDELTNRIPCTNSELARSGNKRACGYEQDISDLLSYIDGYIKSVDALKKETPVKRPRLGLCSKNKVTNAAKLTQQSVSAMTKCSAVPCSKIRIKTNGTLNMNSNKPVNLPKAVASPRKKIAPRRRVVKQLQFSRVTCV